MKLLRKVSVRTLARVLTLVFVSATAASAAVTLRTSPFPGPQKVFGGFARCLARNGGTTTAKVTMTLFSDAGVVLAKNTVTLARMTPTPAIRWPDQTSNPTMCECTVPSSATFTCSLVYSNGPIHVVVPASR